MSASDVFHLADQLASQGRIADAETLLKGLLADLNLDYRSEARFRLGRLRAAQGDLSGAIRWYRELLDHNPTAAYVRVELARVYALTGNEAAAASELRRAGATGLPEDVARIVDQFALALRSQRRLGASIELALAPNSNINLATSGDTISTVLGPLEPDEDARAKSGIGLAVRAQGYARVDLGGVPVLSRLSGQADLYRETRFNDISLSAATGPDLTLGRDRLRPAIVVTQRWFGGEPYSRHIGGTLNLRRILTSTSQVEADLMVAHGNYRSKLQSGVLVNAQLNYDRAFSHRLSGRASVQLARADARDPGYATTSGSVGAILAYRLGDPTIILEGSVGRLAADARLALFPRVRSDRRIDLGAAVLINSLRIADLSPVARIRHSINRSSVDIHDVRQTRFEFGLSREF